MAFHWSGTRLNNVPEKGLHDIVLTKSWFIDQFCYCLLWQIRVIYSEVGLEFPSNPVKKTRSLDSIGDGLHSYQGNETTDTKVLNPSPGSSSLSRKKPAHIKTGSVDLSGRNPVDIRCHNHEEEDNFSDSDTEEEWNKEGMLSAAPQTTYVWRKKKSLALMQCIKFSSFLHKMESKRNKLSGGLARNHQKIISSGNENGWHNIWYYTHPVRWE